MCTFQFYIRPTNSWAIQEISSSIKAGENKQKTFKYSYRIHMYVLPQSI